MTARPFRRAVAVSLPSCILLLLMLGACSAGTRADPAGAASQSEAPPDTLVPMPISGAAFEDARAVAADPFGFLYVADSGRHVVVKLRPTGAIEAVLGGPGSREGEFDGPSGVEPTNGLILYVADAGNRRIQKFSRSYAFLGSVPLTSAGETSETSRVTYRRNDGDGDGFATGRPVAVASADAKELLAIDADRNVVLKWDENLRLSTVIGGVESGRGSLTHPVDIATGPRSRIFVADRGRRAIVVYDAFGTVLRTIGEGHLEQLRAVAVGQDYLYAGHDAAISIYGADGGLLRTIHLALDAPLTDLAVTEEGTLFILTSRQLYTLAP